MERVFDGFALLLILWLTLLLYLFSRSSEKVGELVRKEANITLVANLLLFLILILLELKPDPTLKFFQRLLRFIPGKFSERRGAILHKFSSGLKVFRDFKRMSWILLWSLILWVTKGAIPKLVWRCLLL